MQIQLGKTESYFILQFPDVHCYMPSGLSQFLFANFSLAFPNLNADASCALSDFPLFSNLSSHIHSLIANANVLGV